MMRLLSKKQICMVGGCMLDMMWLICLIMILWIGYKTWGPMDE